MKSLTQLKGILFDLDGVLYVGSQKIDKALETLNFVKQTGLQCRFITNTSTLCQKSLQQKLDNLGFDIPLAEIISAPQAAKLYLQQQDKPVCYLLLADDVKQDFSQFPQSDTEANAIIVGDIGNAWTYPLLNQVFNLLMNGANLIAVHKNRFWQTEAGLQMDIGAFISGLEYATGKNALIIGKPSATFFEMAIADMGLKANEVAIIGDDIDSDIGGGQAVGLTGILVKTGKYRENYVAQSKIVPDFIFDSVADLMIHLA